MLATLALGVAVASLASAHTIITYPGWRGNNLITNDTFPFGMQWSYPCGGILSPPNRTYWPVSGGAVAMQPGWFQGHDLAYININMGFGTDGPWGGPVNYTNVMVPPFQILGPSKGPYPGTICLPQVPLPKGAQPKIGDKATIQVVETAQHGAALFSCVDIEFVADNDARLPEVNETNCFNSTQIGFATLYTVTIKPMGSDNYTTISSAAGSGPRPASLGAWSALGFLPLAIAAAAFVGL